MVAWYNDNDTFCCSWLAELQKAHLISEGKIDGRSIDEIGGKDIGGTWAHFFAGIAGWDYALRLAGWTEDREVWTGSCPCQPFSCAGKRKGTGDKRHLWPEFFRIIGEFRPATIFGEQVASKDGREWFAGVRADLEAMGYAVGGADLCAAGAGSPHIRQRLFWVAYASTPECKWWGESRRQRRRVFHSANSGKNGRMAYPGGAGRGALQRPGEADRIETIEFDGFRETGGMGDPSLCRVGSFGGESGSDDGQEIKDRRPSLSVRMGNAGGKGLEGREGERGNDGEERQAVERTGDDVRGPWASSVWLPCRDGKARRVPSPESGILPLASGVPNRVGLLRGAGNSIVPPLAAEFIGAFLETERV